MDVSIIIVNVNSRQLLQECLTSIYEKSQDIAFEIIVIDNASSDDSVKMVRTRFPQVRLIENSTNSRYAIANNQGLEIAKGKYVFYLNSDTILTGNTVKALAVFLETFPDAGGVGCRMMYPDGTYQDACFRFPSCINVFYLLCLSRFYWKTSLAGSYPNLEKQPSVQTVDFVTGACFMVRRRVLEQCQGMDTDYYFYGEDSDLCYRIWKAGWKICYYPHAPTVIHHGGGSSIHLFDHNQRLKHLRGWKSRFLFIRKHYPFWKKIGILLSVFGAVAFNGAIYSLAVARRRQWDYLAVNMESYLEIAQTAHRFLLKASIKETASE